MFNKVLISITLLALTANAHPVRSEAINTAAVQTSATCNKNGWHRQRCRQSGNGLTRVHWCVGGGCPSEYIDRSCQKWATKVNRRVRIGCRWRKITIFEFEKAKKQAFAEDLRLKAEQSAAKAKEYKLFRTNRTWHAADFACKKWGGTLASIKSFAEQQLVFKVTNRTSRAFWFGANDIKKEGDFRWADGSVMKYTNWGPHEPNDANHSEDCGAFVGSTGKWNDDSCNKPAYYICERKAVLPLQYKLFLEQRTWHAAGAACKKWGGTLASIKSAAEQKLVDKAIKGTSERTWFSANDINKIRDWRQADGSQIKYNNWGKRQPLNYNSREGKRTACAAIKCYYNTWFTYRCDTKTQYICEKNRAFASEFIKVKPMLHH